MRLEIFRNRVNATYENGSPDLFPKFDFILEKCRHHLPITCGTVGNGSPLMRGFRPKSAMLTQRGLGSSQVFKGL